MAKKENCTIQSITINPADLPDETPVTEALPIMPTRDFVLFPEVTFPISLGRESSLKTARLAAEQGTVVGVVCQKNPQIESPSVADLAEYGVFARVLKVIDLPDGSSTAIINASGRFRITGVAQQEEKTAAFPLRAQVKPLRDPSSPKNDIEFIAMVNAIKRATLDIFKNAGDVPDDLRFNVEHSTIPSMLVNLVATHAPFGRDIKLHLLSINRIKERAMALLTNLSQSRQLSEISADLARRTKARIDMAQRNAFLQQQLEAIRQELYGDDIPDSDALRKQLQEKQLPEAVCKTMEREISKLDRFSPSSPEYAVQLSYIETVLDLPWGKSDTATPDFSSARDSLDAAHFGLPKIKNRILQQIALAIHSPKNPHAPILCLTGAPGVGKTSLGQSIAKAMGRQYQRVSLGGLHDEAEIRGHRRTYIGAMPGRIIDAVRRAGTTNPLILLDEIDKIGSDFKGDPSAALLEVLDPEQNCRFHDNYIDIDFDLSNVTFIATANNLQTVPAPLLDRMEIIEIPGYLPEEKLRIAQRHLIPRSLEEHALTDADLTISDQAVSDIISLYTAESGVRQLQKQIARIARQSILERLSGNKEGKVNVEPADLEHYLGTPQIIRHAYREPDTPGLVPGLAWTAAGGELLYIEASLSPAKAYSLQITGNLGDIMKESATIASHWVRSHASVLGIDPGQLESRVLSIHAPEGAIPKDGPSAGITLVSAIISAYTGIKPLPYLAMTGEISLTGRILAVGGLKEKILAALRHGIREILLPADTRAQVEEDIPAEHLSRLTLHYVSSVREALRIIFPQLAPI